MHVTHPHPDDPEALLADAGFVRRLARSLVRDAALAEDVAQEVLVAAWRAPAPAHGWRNWLATVTRRLAAKARRAASIRAAHEAHAARAADGDPERRTRERLELQRQLTDAVLALPEPYRTAVTLRFFDDLPPRAIARRLGWSGDVTRQRLSRGLALLRERLDGEFGSRRAWLGALAGLAPGVGITVPGTLLAVITMHKLAVAAAILLAGGAIWIVADAAAAPPSAPRTRTDVVDAGPPATAPSDGAARTPDRARVDAAAPVCGLSVHDPSGRPIAGAAVSCWDATGDVVAATTDEHGRVQFAAKGPGGLLAQHAGHRPAQAALGERQGEHVLVLDDGDACGGVLLVDGQPAAAGTKLRLSGSGEFALPDLPPALAPARTWQPQPEVLVGANGAFRIDGLPADARVRAALPRHLWLLPESGGTEAEHRSFALTAGRFDVVVQATRLWTIEGTVVWDDDGTPVPHTGVDVYATFADGSNTPWTGAAADEAGHFVVGLLPSSSGTYADWCRPERRPAVLRVELQAANADSAGATAVELDRERYLAGPVEVRLVRAPIGHFVAVDANGAPLAGARVATRRALGEPSGADGRGTFRGTPADVFLVGAPGHRIGPTEPRAPAAGTAADPLVFELMDENVVTVHLVDADDRLPDVDGVELSAPCRPLAGRRSGSAIDQALAGTEWFGNQVVTNGRDYDARLPLPAAGTRLELRSLEPGVPVRIALFDALGNEVVGESVVVPPFGDRAAVTLRVARRPSAVAGSVRAEPSSPIGGAQVELQALDARGQPLVHAGGRVASARSTTAADGSFRFAPLYVANDCRITVTAPGFARLERVLATGQLDTEQSFVLERGHRVDVHVVDDGGAAVPLVAALRDGEARRERIADGVTRFDDLPSGRVRFTVRIGNDDFAIEHDTAEPVATIRVPRPGRLALRCANGWPAVDERSTLMAHAQRVGRDDPPVSIWRPDRDGAPPELLPPGRWRVSLVESRQHGAIPLGLSAEVEVIAGELTTAVLR